MEHRDNPLHFAIYVDGRRWARTASQRRAAYLLNEAKTRWPLANVYLLPY